jgi:phage tail protein X
MFARGSRYYNVSESAPVDAAGERLVGKDVRVIPDTPGTFQHAVAGHDRLDLLAYKYYGDSTRWWQIADANPAFPFPPDLLDRGPLVEELLALVDADNAARLQSLLATWNAIGQVKLQSSSLVIADIVVSFAPAARPQILSAIGQYGFRLVRSYTWTAGAATFEAFTLDDRDLKTRWRAMVQRLDAMPGLAAVLSNLAEATLRIAYNGAVVARADIVAAMGRSGFAISPTESQRVERIGARIVIPPNGPG